MKKLIHWSENDGACVVSLSEYDGILTKLGVVCFDFLLCLPDALEPLFHFRMGHEWFLLF
jgi:hypothetical protein